MKAPELTLAKLSKTNRNIRGQFQERVALVPAARGQPVIDAFVMSFGPPLEAALE